MPNTKNSDPNDTQSKRQTGSRSSDWKGEEKPGRAIDPGRTPGKAEGTRDAN